MVFFILWSHLSNLRANLPPSLPDKPQESRLRVCLFPSQANISLPCPKKRWLYIAHSAPWVRDIAHSALWVRDIAHWTLHIAHSAPWVRDGPFPVPFLTRSADDGIFYCDSITTKFRACPPLPFTHPSVMQHCRSLVTFEISCVVFCVLAIHSKFACRFGLCPVFRW